MKRGIFIIILIIYNLSCNTFSSENDLQFLPREVDVPGWKVSLAPQRYTDDNIHQYLKESCKLYKKYGFKELLLAKYSSINDINRVITVEVYRMNSSLNAFGIMSYERGFDYKESAVFCDSYTTSRGFFFRKGKCYIKIETNSDKNDIHKDKNTFAGVVNNKIGKANGALPDYITLFSSGKIASDFIYYIDGPMELPGIKNLFVRRKQVSGKERLIFFTRRDTHYDSMKDFTYLLKGKDHPFILSSAGELQIAFNKSKDGRFTFISVYKEWIFGVIEVGSLIEGRKIVIELHRDILNFIK